MNDPTQPRLQTIVLNNGEVVQARSMPALSEGSCSGCAFGSFFAGTSACKYSIAECVDEGYDRIFIESSDEALAKYITAKHFSGTRHG